MIEELITLRASFLIERVVTGLRMNFDKALGLLKNQNDSTSGKERKERKILLAAIDNLVDFAAHEEISMLGELPKERISDGIDAWESIFKKYNLTYAGEENGSVLHAALIAGCWLRVDEGSILTFMTQADERVRSWHLSLQGLSYPKNDFPAGLIPPIEWGCRCFLISNGFDSVVGALGETGYTKQINPVFSESLAKGGKIFSHAHPYFKTPLPEQAIAIVKRIKQKFNF